MPGGELAGPRLLLRGVQLRGDLPVPRRGRPPRRTLELQGVLRRSSHGTSTRATHAGSTCPTCGPCRRNGCAAVRPGHRRGPAVRPARIALDHAKPRRCIDVVGYLTARPKAMPPSPETSGVASRASTTPAPSCTATHCNQRTQHCAGKYEGAAMPPSPPTSTAGSRPPCGPAVGQAPLAPRTGRRSGRTGKR